MLERTAGCLEAGCIRRFLPSPSKTVKSRRTLHSAFWNHAAGDIEISPLWAALMQGKDARQEEMALEQRNLNGNGGLFLDFLYPVGTLNFIRNYSAFSLDKQWGRWGRAGLARLGQRPYTSSTADASPMGENASDGDVLENASQLSSHGCSTGFVFEKLGLLKRDDYDEAWRQYVAIDTGTPLSEKQLLQRHLITYLSTSSRVVDAERIVDVFNLLTEKDPDGYQHAIQAYILLRNLPDALRLNTEALEQLGRPVGSDNIFCYLASTGSWARAGAVWLEYKKWERVTARTDRQGYDLYKVIEKLPSFEKLVCDLIKNVNQEHPVSITSESDRPTLVKMATSMARKAFILRGRFHSARFMLVLDHLHKWDVIDPQQLETNIRHLLSIGEKSLVVKVYRQLREGDGLKFTHPTLHTILKTFCVGHSTRGIQEVLDDFFRHYKQPTKFAYKLSMTEFAARRDAQTVKTLFDRFMGHHHPPGRPLKDPDFLSPLLHVHSKRGDLQEVIKNFDMISEKYGLTPSILCWNILIAAHGRAKDTDGAFGCFQTLLDTPGIKPNDYTFGTLMGIAAIRGDISAVEEVYRLAEDLRVERSVAMVDSLVKTHIDNDDIPIAESVCEEALHIQLRGSRTRMWNYLIVAYSMRRDLVNANRILQRMSQTNVEHDEFTYAALMQALCMVKQPDQAYKIMTEVLPKAGFRPNSFHFAVLLGGFFGNGQISRVFRMHEYLLRRNLPKTASTNAMMLRAQLERDSFMLERGTETEKYQRAMEMFLNMAFDPQEETDVQKGIQGNSYYASIHGYVMHMLSRKGEMETSLQIYDRYKSSAPPSQLGEHPISIISALLYTKYRERDRKGVDECWNMILSKSWEEFKPISHPVLKTQPEAEEASNMILFKHQLAFSRSLSYYIKALGWDSRTDQMTITIESLLREGFVLDNHNWNTYIEQLLRKRAKIKLAFQVCENKLMPGFTGWSKIRQQLPVRNRLPKVIRNMRKSGRHYRPLVSTSLALTKAYIGLREMAVESPAYRFLLEDLEKGCPKTVEHIKSMPTSSDVREMDALGDL